LPGWTLFSGATGLLRVVLIGAVLGPTYFANELLHRIAIEAACAEERESYDFGLYQTEELKRFKTTFGAHGVPVCSYYFEKLPTVAAEAKCYDAAKQVLRTVLRLARRRGE
jgi:hypothetical protein